MICKAHGNGWKCKIQAIKDGLCHHHRSIYCKPRKRKGGWPKGKKRGTKKDWSVTLGTFSGKRIKKNTNTETLNSLMASTHTQLRDSENARHSEESEVQSLRNSSCDWRAKYEALRALLLDVYRLGSDMKISWESK